MQWNWVHPKHSISHLIHILLAFFPFAFYNRYYIERNGYRQGGKGE